VRNFQILIVFAVKICKQYLILLRFVDLLAGKQCSLDYAIRLKKDVMQASVWYLQNFRSNDI